MTSKVVGTILMILVVISFEVGIFGETPRAMRPSSSTGAPAAGELPLLFTADAGRTHPSVEYVARTSATNMYFTRQRIVLDWPIADRSPGVMSPFIGRTRSVPAATPQRRFSLALELLDVSSATRIVPTHAAPVHVNYIVGADRAGWRTKLATYAELVYHDVWPGIDMAVRGGGDRLKYEFRVSPGARVDSIRLAYRGARRVAIAPDGSLAIATEVGTLSDSRPISYQEYDGNRVEVESGFVLSAHDGAEYGFAVGEYDAKRPLVIDPGLEYSTYFGGTDLDWAVSIAVDAAGAAYITGQTGSLSLPTTAGAYDATFNGAANVPIGGDAFVAKLSPDGSTLVYATYIGGWADDQASAIVVDSFGRAIITGFTASFDFPTTATAFDRSYNGSTDAFVLGLDETGSTVSFATFLGGQIHDLGRDLTLDAFGDIYVTGSTGGNDFPTTLGSFVSTVTHGRERAFVAKLDPTASTLVYSTYLGNFGTLPLSIAADNAGHAYVAGTTESVQTTTGAFAPMKSGNYQNGFVTKLNPSGSALVYSTYLGGQNTQVLDLDIDANGNAYVTGLTSSGTFPTTSGALRSSLAGGSDGFVTKLNSTGSALVYSTYLGGTSGDSGWGIAVDPVGQVYVAGETRSIDFPVSTDAFDAIASGSYDAYVVKLNTGGTVLLYGSYLGGSGYDVVMEVALDRAGGVYLSGMTDSAHFIGKRRAVGFPVTPGAYDTVHNGSFDAFITKLSLGSIFQATFTADSVGSAPGPPEIGTWSFAAPAGTVLVASQAGDLAAKPVVLTQEADLGGSLYLAGTVAGTPPSSGRYVAQWRSAVTSPTAFFGPIVLRDSNGLVLAALEYRAGGAITYGTSPITPPVAVGLWQQGVSQTFEITVDLSAKTTSLRINGLPAAAAQNVPFYQSAAANFARIGFEPGGTFAQTFAWDDIDVHAK